jgi:methyl-accepting chemotaxis protein
MNSLTIPRRITLGFLILLALSLLVGGIALWQLLSIKQNVVWLADNSIPSVVMLNDIIKQNAETAKQVLRAVRAIEKDATVVPSDAAFRAAQAKGDELCRGYSKLFSDAEDERIFAAATAARVRYLTVARTVLDLVGSGKAKEARALLESELEPEHETVVALFDEDIAYNISLANAEGVKAKRTAAATSVLIASVLAASALLGCLIGLGIIRTVSRALGRISDSLQEGATHTASASGQLASASNSLATGCSEQSSSVAETSAALEEMSAMIRSTADNAEKAKVFAQQARSAAQTGAETMAEMNTAMHAIEDSSAEVAKIVKNIDEIAFQTNILALNAAVEAARAGEAGAGFAVVADEVRSLAQRSAAAAKETADKIEAAIINSKRGSTSCEKVGESLAEIVQKVAAADGLVAEIATAAKEQSQGIQQVGVAMTQMDKVTQGNAASAQQSASAAEELNNQAHHMQENVRALRELVIRSRRASGAAVPAAPAAPRTPALPGAAPRRLPAPRRTPPRIEMPGDTSSPDQEDRHFANF